MVGDGSGCFFQPMTEDYTYILTAKHLFFDEIDDERGRKTKTEKADGTPIKIRQQIKTENTWALESITFALKKGVNYFPHAHADIAILKITRPQRSVNQIYTTVVHDQGGGFFLCGFPKNSDLNPEGEKWSSREVENFMASGDYSHGAQVFGALGQANIEGFSGGGILRINGDSISIIGIQSKMASRQLPAGQIGFVPIKYAKEIIRNEQYRGLLESLAPPFNGDFEFLRDQAFALEVDDIEESNVVDTRVTLRNKALEIVRSDITPEGIRRLFAHRLLVSESDESCLSFKAVWIAWLEFLTILNIVKYDSIDASMLSDIFNRYRLKYVDADDWTHRNIIEKFGKSDYKGLVADSTVYVGSKGAPKTTLKIPKGKMIDIGKPYDKAGFRTDIGIDPYTCFDFVHLDSFKTGCIIRKLRDFENLNEVQILEKLKQEYNDFFN